MKNKKWYILLALVVLLITIIGATYAYFVAQKGTGGSAQIEVGAGTTDSLQFTNGEEINIIANQDNFQKNGENQSGNSRVTATLTANNTTKEAKDMYNVYLVIEDNEFVYTTEDSKPELVLKIINPESMEVTSMNAVKYVDEVGFDITELSPGIYPIVKGYDIEAKGDAKVDNWEITVTLINLDQDQNENAGKSFTGRVYITRDDLKENDLIKINSIVSTTTARTINVDLKVGEEIGQVNKYYFAIEETDETLEDIKEESVASALAKEYIESSSSSYEFTKINDEPLKEEQNYKIYGYGVDTKGFRSNIYETIVRTEEYEIPVIERVSHEENNNSTTITVVGQSGTGKISKYQYSLDGDVWIDSDDSGIITINDLEYNKSYDLKIRVVDENERYSNTWIETIKIIKYGTEEYPYSIKTIDDLVKLSTEVNGGNLHINEYYKLENNLDFAAPDSYKNNVVDDSLITGNGFTPIGSDNSPFAGIFDGNNKKITNLNINNSTKQMIGLFGTIRNSKIYNLEVNGNVNTNINSNTGLIVGNLYDSEINNCSSSGTIVSTAGSYSTGGIVGAVYGNNKILNSHNTAKVTGGAWIGGIVGGFGSGNLLIENSYNKGDISKVDDVELQGLGGLLGAAIVSDDTYGITIKNSYNQGKVTDTLQSDRTSAAGGLIGKSYVNVTLENTHNTGDVTLVHDKYTAGMQSSLGGLIGYIYNANITIRNSYNEATILNGEDNAGLIAYAILANVMIEKSHNSGLIKANNVNPVHLRMGGLMGFSNNSDVTILDSYNDNSIIGTTGHTEYFISGIIGVHDHGKTINIFNTYNLGNVESGKNAGGITYIYGNSYEGKYTNLLLNNCYNLGKITGTASYAIGYLNPNTVTNINNTYYDNTYSSSNVANIGTPMSLADMKKLDFVLTLNNNLKNINLSNINPNYKLSNFTLRNNYAQLPLADVPDLSGNNNTLSNYGVKVSDEGITTRVDDNQGYLNTNLVNVDFSQGLTYIIKLKVSDFTKGMAIMGNWETKGGGLYYNSGSSFCLDMYELTPPWTICSSKTYQTNTWYTLVGTYIDSKLKLYVINDANVDTYELPTSGSISPVITPITIGMDPDIDSNGYLNGHNYGTITVKEALIFKRSLDDLEIKNNYVNSLNPLDKTNLVAWYKF